MIRCLVVAAYVLAITVAPAQVVSAAGARTGSPVAIAFERKTVQTLADGTHISRTTHEWFYRDMQGRTRREYELNISAGQPEAPRTSVIVTDSVAGETVSWVSGPGMQQTYSVSQPQVSPQPGAVPIPTGQMGGDAGLRPAPAPTLNRATSPELKAARPIVHRENLGVQEVQGVPCQANRTTTTYPIDMLGNDRPITVVREVCTSRELNVTLREHADDPRTGVRTLAVLSLSRTDPDPALFSPPPGYVERPVSPAVMPK